MDFFVCHDPSASELAKQLHKFSRISFFGGDFYFKHSPWFQPRDTIYDYAQSVTFPVVETTGYILKFVKIHVIASPVR